MSEEEDVNKCHSSELQLGKWRPQDRREDGAARRGPDAVGGGRTRDITRRQWLPRGAAVCTLAVLVIEDDYG